MCKKILFTFIILIGCCYSLYAFQEIENPKIKWKFKSQGSIRGGAVINANTIYFGSADGFIYALNKNNGSLIWKYKTDAPIISSPLIYNGTLYIANRSETLYAINIEDGHTKWSFKMGKLLTDNHGGWKYFMASPVVSGENILIGSGDGKLYAINVRNGELNWKYATKGRIRATALVDNGKIYQPSNDGYVYVLNLDGTLSWKFATKGTTYEPSDFNFDRSSINAQPIIKDNILFIASRDGNTYGIDINTHQKIWDFKYGTTWAISSNISENSLYIGWSTNNLFSALDIETGQEKWQYKADGHNYTKALISTKSIYFGSADGFLYKLDKNTGEKKWAYHIGQEIFSSPIYNSNTIYFGCDDGNLYAMEEGVKVFKAVFHPVNKKGSYKQPSSSNKITPYLETKGFDHIATKEGLQKFIVERLNDNAPSVIVFPYLIIPYSLVGQDPEKGLMRQYLNKGGKVIWMGDIPNYYARDKSGKQIRSPLTASKLLDVTFTNPGESGNYYSKTTQEGQNLGLPLWIKTTSISVTSDNLIPLAYNEFGGISAWMKQYNSRQGSGFISCRTWAWNVDIKQKDLELIHLLAISYLE